MREIQVIDDFMPDPEAYRRSALQQEFKSYPFYETGPDGQPVLAEIFHGIAIGGTAPGLFQLQRRVPTFDPNTFAAYNIYATFFRLSPLNQPEPNFIHTDVDMGTCSAILYLNPEPPEGDGTTFWMHAATGEIGHATPHFRSKEGQIAEGWIMRRKIDAKFNRLVLWRSDLYHSRSLKENWGNAEEARLTQITFGKGHF